MKTERKGKTKKFKRESENFFCRLKVFCHFFSQVLPANSTKRYRVQKEKRKKIERKSFRVKKKESKKENKLRATKPKVGGMQFHSIVYRRYANVS